MAQSFYQEVSAKFFRNYLTSKNDIYLHEPDFQDNGFSNILKMKSKFLNLSNKDILTSDHYLSEASRQMEPLGFYHLRLKANNLFEESTSMAKKEKFLSLQSFYELAFFSLVPLYYRMGVVLDEGKNLFKKCMSNEDFGPIHIENILETALGYKGVYSININAIEIQFIQQLVLIKYYEYHKDYEGLQNQYEKNYKLLLDSNHNEIDAFEYALRLHFTKQYDELLSELKLDQKAHLIKLKYFNMENIKMIHQKHKYPQLIPKIVKNLKINLNILLNSMFKDPESLGMIYYILISLSDFIINEETQQELQEEYLLMLFEYTAMLIVYFKGDLSLIANYLRNCNNCKLTSYLKIFSPLCQSLITFTKDCCQNMNSDHFIYYLAFYSYILFDENEAQDDEFCSRFSNLILKHNSLIQKIKDQDLTIQEIFLEFIYLETTKICEWGGSSQEQLDSLMKLKDLFFNQKFDVKKMRYFEYQYYQYLNQKFDKIQKAYQSQIQSQLKKKQFNDLDLHTPQNITRRSRNDDQFQWNVQRSMIIQNDKLSERLKHLKINIQAVNFDDIKIIRNICLCSATIIVHEIEYQQKIYACKIFYKQKGDEEVDSVIQELKKQISLQTESENIVKIHFIANNFNKKQQTMDIAIIMDYYKNTLDDVIQTINLKQRKKTILQIITVFEIIHRTNSIHSVIKPQNILVDLIPTDQYDIKVYIVQSTWITLSKSLQSDNGGTEGFQSPEQKDDYKTNQSSDVYSIGLVLYCIITKTKAEKMPEIYKQKNLLTQDFKFSEQEIEIIDQELKSIMMLIEKMCLNNRKDRITLEKVKEILEQ